MPAVARKLNAGFVERQLVGRTGRLGLLESNRDQFRDAGFLHGDAVQALGGLHGALGVRDHDELSLIGHLLQQPREAFDVRLIERRVDFVQNAEGARRVVKNGHQKRHCGERFFSAR